MKAPHAHGMGSVGADLAESLALWGAGSPLHRDIARTIIALAEAAGGLARLVAHGPLASPINADTLNADMGAANVDGDRQTFLDVEANRRFLACLDGGPVRYFASEEEDTILTLQPDGTLALAVDPLDGSSNIDVNVSVGSIFSLFAVAPTGATASFLRPAAEQVAAGYFIYGPHTALVLTVGNGVDLYVLDPGSGRFRQAGTGLCIPVEAAEYAINASNYRHWSSAVRSYIDDCLEGLDGPHGRNFNMRWIASLVVEMHRIVSRGGVFLYPADTRKGYECGRLRFVYEAAPIALLAEQAGGAATDGTLRILDLAAQSLHQRTPLIFGSADAIAAISEYHHRTPADRAPPPLFQRRGLFRS